MDFYAYQEAAYVSIDNTSDGLDFSMSTYYCTIDWETNPPGLRSGYHGLFGVVRLVRLRLGRLALSITSRAGRAPSAHLALIMMAVIGSEEISLPQPWIGNQSSDFFFLIYEKERKQCFSLDRVAGSHRHHWHSCLSSPAGSGAGQKRRQNAWTAPTTNGKSRWSIPCSLMITKMIGRRFYGFGLI